MTYETIESKFIATPEKGEVSSILMRPNGAKWILVFGHGAGTNMRHSTLQTIAERLADIGIATFRYQFPYMERGGGGRESEAVARQTVRSAAAAAQEAASDLSILVGGHSYSGRMSSMSAAKEPIEHVKGLVFFAFPLHPAGREGTERAEHLADVTIPMLFLSGTRDKLAVLDLLEPVCEKLDKATLHLLDTADHGFKVLKRSRKSEEDVFVEMARVLSEWIATLN